MPAAQLTAFLAQDPHWQIGLAEAHAAAAA